MTTSFEVVQQKFRAPKRREKHCVARVGYRPCSLLATAVVGEVLPLCADHVEHIRPDIARVFGEGKVEVVRVNVASRSVVYYLGDPPTQTVKIGTSSNFRERLAGVRWRFPECVLLAVEPGDFKLERARHAQFRHLRVKQRGQTEWFRKTSELMDHVNEIRARIGAPEMYRPQDRS